MIGGLEWELDEPSGKISATLEKPRRDLTIAWDDGDKSLYLSVVAPAPPNVQGAQQRAYSAPLSLLAALSILPAKFHPTLVATTDKGRTDADAESLEAIYAVLENAPAKWPAPARAVEAQGKLAEHLPTVERLALDLAAADAYRDLGTPV